MRYPFGPVRISLGAVVLDTPDRSGVYVAKDLVGGWAYLVSDADGDHRFHGEGYCPGGIDVALRWALLAALSRVPESRQILLLVENRQAHRITVRLAQGEDPVINGIGGRPLAILTRPEERSVRRARNAAELAASVVLREHERSEASRLAIEAAEREMVEGVEDTDDDVLDLHGWRLRRGLPRLAQENPPELVQPPLPAVQAGRLERLVGGLRTRLAGPGLPGWRRKPADAGAVGTWMKDFDLQIDNVKSELEGIGA